jgi:hypothetical protein
MMKNYFKMRNTLPRQIILVIISLLVLIFAASCSRKNPLANQRSVTAITTSRSESGFLYVKANGFGKNPKDAQNEAIRNALSAVLFQGVPGSSVKRPLINQPGARQEYSEFFDPFFADNGKYLDYAVVMSSLSTDRIKVKSGVQRAIQLKVNYLQLQKMLEQQSIIKKFGI